jgi:general stress protein YciG
MAIREQNDDRRFGNDRERPREVASEMRGASSGDEGSSSARSRGRSNRGFASMDREKQREIASKGGRAAHAKGTAHEFNSNEARDAGRKGGVAVSRNREHMAAIGRKGGEARGAARRAQTPTASSGRDLGATGGARGATQNSRAGTGGMMADREVGIHGANQNTGGSVSSLGGERNRPNTNARGEENVERP